METYPQNLARMMVTDHRTVRPRPMLAPLAARCPPYRAVQARLLPRSRATALKFKADRGGNVTWIFALAVIPIFGAVAVAVDYSRGNSARTAMQAVPGATTLMVSEEPLKNSQVQQKARTNFKSQFTRPDMKI